MCKQTQAIHDKKSIYDCASEIIIFSRKIDICKFAVYKIEDITFIPLTAGHQYIVIPQKEIEIHILCDAS